jgi:hypothetical protein
MGDCLLVQLYENCRIGPHFCATLFPSIDYVFFLTKNGLGYISGDFFANSSGHPDARHRYALMEKLTSLNAALNDGPQDTDLSIVGCRTCSRVFCIIMRPNAFCQKLTYLASKRLEFRETDNYLSLNSVPLTEVKSKERKKEIYANFSFCWKRSEFLF